MTINHHTKCRFNHTTISFMYEFKSNSLVSLFWRKVDFVEIVIKLKITLFIRLTHSFKTFFNTFILFLIFNNFFFSLTIWFDETFFNLFFKSLILTINVFTKIELINDDWMINDEFFIFFFKSTIFTVNVFIKVESIIDDWMIDEKTNVNDWDWD